MMSLLVISKNKKVQEEFIADFCHKQHIHPFDQHLVTNPDPEQKGTKTKIGIEEIRQIQKTIFLKPLKGKKKIVIIKNAGMLTIEAQNALLKTLEEPPHSCFLLLLAESKNALLPTIISRCREITLPDTPQVFSENEEIDAFLATLLTGNSKEALEVSEKLSKNKKDALNLLTAVTLKARDELRHNLDNQEKRASLLVILKDLQKTSRILTTNTNPRLVLEALLLRLKL